MSWQWLRYYVLLLIDSYCKPVALLLMKFIALSNSNRMSNGRISIPLDVLQIRRYSVLLMIKHDWEPLAQLLRKCIELKKTKASLSLYDSHVGGCHANFSDTSCWPASITKLHFDSIKCNNPRSMLNVRIAFSRLCTQTAPTIVDQLHNSY